MIRNVQKLLNRSAKKKVTIQLNQGHSKQQEGPALSSDFNINLETFRSIYENCSDVVFREFLIFEETKAFVIYIDGLSDTLLLDEHVISPLQKKPDQESKHSLTDFIENSITPASQMKKVHTVAECIESIANGMPVLIYENSDTGFSFGFTKFETRSIEEPQAEKSIRGPREGFIESLQVNTSLIRRVIKSPALKIQTMKIGQYTKTNVALIYIDGIANPTLIEEVENRLNRIDIDGVLDSEYIEEFIEDNPYSPFPQILSTERPDVASANLLEGRAVIMTDGSPFALIAPVSLFSLLQAHDDYYERYIVGTLIRWLRYLFLPISILLPSLYVAITTFHQEMLPDKLLISIAASREAVPFPAIVEVVLMELMLEALREAGVRLPNQIGAAVSIVGALVIGQASVEAGLVSAPMVIVVATTGIASFMIPRYIVGYAIRFLRFPLIFFAGTLGLLGIMLGILLIIVHLCTLRSFGEPYLKPIAPLKKQDLKDVLWRSPLWMMNRRPLSGDLDQVRQAPNQKPGPLKGGEG